MKKSIYLILCTAALLFTSCGKQELKPINIQPIVIDAGDITYEVDPRAELIIIASRLAGIRAFSDSIDVDYVNTVDKMFEKLKDHPFVKQLKKTSKKFYGNADYELKIAEYISTDLTSFTVQKKEMPAYLDEFWKGVNFNKLIKDYNDFAVKGNFEKIWKLYELHLKGELSKTKVYFDKKPEILSFYKNYFAGDENIKFVISTSPILGSWIISMPVYMENNHKVVKLYQSPWAEHTSDSDDVYTYMQYASGVSSALVHENWDKISDKTKTVVDKICKDNKISTKNFKTSAYKYNLIDYLSTALTSEYIFANKEPELAEEIDKAYKKYSFMDFDKIIGMLEEYKSNRQKYPAFEVFFTEYLINAINNEF